MISVKYIRIIFLLVLGGSGTYAASAQSAVSPKKHKRHSVYFSWGYNAEWYTRSNVHVKQDELGNDYTFNKVKATDHRGWDEGLFKQQLTIPQYNYRIGYMLDEDRGIGIEINFDHTKYIIALDQDLHMTGQFQGRNVDTNIRFSSENGFHYYLNNGANFFLINLVKRMHLWHDKQNIVRIDALGKAGIGPVVPHVDNQLFGGQNDPHFQLGGWNTGVEADIKATFWKYAYLEYGFKGDYARYSGLRSYKGDARQSFGTFEMILSLGINIPTGRKKG